jgi:hypothetical protein
MCIGVLSGLDGWMECIRRRHDTEFDGIGV